MILKATAAESRTEEAEAALLKVTGSAEVNAFFLRSLRVRL